jgi:hypothetical protein
MVFVPKREREAECTGAIFSGLSFSLMRQQMTDDNAPDPVAQPMEIDLTASDDAIPSRRRLLALGAVGAGAALTIRPALAQTAVSVMNCQIPVPGPAAGGQYIDPYGKLVPAGTQGAFPGTTRPFTGEQVKAAFRGRTLPGTTYEQNQAYLQYIRRLQAGQSGFTCFASIQMPR